jgi:ketosteroid isomerase-like protein
MNDVVERNVELTRRGFEAYNARDFDALGALLDPDVELHASASVLNGGDYRGREGFLQWNAEWDEAWEGFVAEPAEIEPMGEHALLVRTHQVATGAGSGVDVEMTVFWALEVVGGLVTKMHLYPDREEALAAIERWGRERGRPE